MFKLFICNSSLEKVDDGSTKTSVIVVNKEEYYRTFEDENELLFYVRKNPLKAGFYKYIVDSK